GRQDISGSRQEALRVLLALALGDVGGDPDHADDLAPPVADDTAASLDPPLGAVRQDDPVLELVPRARLHGSPHAGRDPFTVLRMDPLDIGLVRAREAARRE